MEQITDFGHTFSVSNLQLVFVGESLASLVCIILRLWGIPYLLCYLVLLHVPELTEVFYFCGKF